MAPAPPVLGPFFVSQHESLRPDDEMKEDATETRGPPANPPEQKVRHAMAPAIPW